MNNLVAYFSATGTTKRKAESVAELIQADLFEIEPVEKYTSEDFNWKDENSRTTKEKNDDAIRPAIAKRIDNIDKYNNILLFFPVW